MPGQKILVVDDEPEVLDLVASLLSSEGYEVITAADGEDAIKLFFREKPDLVLMDIILPDIDGSDVVARIRAEIPADRYVPVIFLSGIISAGDRKQNNEVTVAGLSYRALPKPFSHRQLMDEVRSALE